MSTSRVAPQRLARRELTSVGRHASGALVVSVLTGLTVAGFVSVPIALLAAGAGAGYSLSGSV